MFINYCLINNTTITTADGHKLKALEKGDVQIKLLNGAKHTKTIVKEAIHAPDMAFTLILVSQLDDVKCSMTFSGGMCTICNPSSCTMVTILCAKAKVAQHPFPKELETHASKYRECIHWDLWGPTSVQSLSRNLYVAACIDDVTCETMLYFQAKKSRTINSYKCNEALIKTQTGNCIKVAHSN